MGRFPLILLALLSFANAEFVELRSPRVTNWGHKYDWSDCPSGMFAYGMQIKYEEHQGGKDDSGLNAVSLYCKKPDWNQNSKENWIMSGEGGRGKWQKIKYCPNGTLIVGFALRSEPHQGSGDDVAAVNFAAHCGLVDGPRNRNTWLEGKTVNWGNWTADQWCPQEFAVCAIRSQIEGNQGGGDETALNNVDLKCCRHFCTPEQKLVEVHTCDNSKGEKEVSTEFYSKIGFTRTTRSTEPISREEKEAILKKISAGFTMNGWGIHKALIKNGTQILNVRQETESFTIDLRELKLMVQDAMTNERWVRESLSVPRRAKMVIEQLFLFCGKIKVSLAMTKVRLG